MAHIGGDAYDVFQVCRKGCHESAIAPVGDTDLLADCYVRNFAGHDTKCITDDEGVGTGVALLKAGDVKRSVGGSGNIGTVELPLIADRWRAYGEAIQRQRLCGPQ